MRNKKEIVMSDDRSKVGAADRQRINPNENYEVRYWAKKFNVSEDRLREAAKKAGPMVDDVRRELGV